MITRAFGPPKAEIVEKCPIYLTVLKCIRFTYLLRDVQRRHQLYVAPDRRTGHGGKACEHCGQVEVFQFSDLYNPEADDFQNLMVHSLSKNMCLVKFQ